MASGKKISHAEWFGDLGEDEPEPKHAFGGPLTEGTKKAKLARTSTSSKDSFSKKIFDTKEGRLLLELQKTYKGDERFRLDKRFKNDVDYEKLPNTVKLVTRDIIAEENYANEREREVKEKQKKEEKKEEKKARLKEEAAAGKKDESEEGPQVSLGEEREKQKNILRELIPEGKVFSKSVPKAQGGPANYIVPRFDPKNQKACKELIIKKDKPPVVKNGKKAAKTPQIESGIDKAKKNLMMANFLLGKMKEKTAAAASAEGEEEVHKLKKRRKINYSKWKEIIDENVPSTNSFSLFS